MLKGVVTGAWSSLTVVYGVRINLENMSQVTLRVLWRIASCIIIVRGFLLLFSTLHVELNRLAVTLTEAMQIIHNDRNHVHTQGSINHLIS